MDGAYRLLRLQELVCRFYDIFYASDGVGSESTMRESEVFAFGRTSERDRCYRASSTQPVRPGVFGTLPTPERGSGFLPRRACGLFGMMSPALLLVGLLRLRTAPYRSRRRTS